MGVCWYGFGTVQVWVSAGRGVVSVCERRGVGQRGPGITLTLSLSLTLSLRLSLTLTRTLTLTPTLTLTLTLTLRRTSRSAA